MQMNILLKSSKQFEALDIYIIVCHPDGNNRHARKPHVFALK